MRDSVNHPSHYNWLPNGIEVIDVVENLNFCMGNAVKYILRADHKGKPVEDLQKAAWYLEREIQNRQKEKPYESNQPELELGQKTRFTA